MKRIIIGILTIFAFSFAHAQEKSTNETATISTGSAFLTISGKLTESQVKKGYFIEKCRYNQVSETPRVAKQSCTLLKKAKFNKKIALPQGIYSLYSEVAGFTYVELSSEEHKEIRLKNIQLNTKGLSWSVYVDLTNSDMQNLLSLLVWGNSREEEGIEECNEYEHYSGRAWKKIL